MAQYQNILNLHKNITAIVLEYLIIVSMDFFNFSLVLGSVEKIYQTLEPVFYHTSKCIKIGYKCPAGIILISNIFLSVWKCGKAHSFM